MASPLPPFPPTLSLPTLTSPTAVVTWAATTVLSLKNWSSAVRSWSAAQQALETKQARYRGGESVTISTSGGRPLAVSVIGAVESSGANAKPNPVPDWTWTGDAVRIDSIDSLTVGVDYTITVVFWRDAGDVSS